MKLKYFIFTRSFDQLRTILNIQSKELLIDSVRLFVWVILIQRFEPSQPFFGLEAYIEITSTKWENITAKNSFTSWSNNLKKKN